MATPAIDIFWVFPSLAYYAYINDFVPQILNNKTKQLQINYESV